VVPRELCEARKEREEAAQKHREEEKEKQEAAQKIERETKTITDSSTENVGTINVEVESTLHWSCPGCAQSNFIINNSNSDSHQITVNALNETSGETVVDEGVYHDFEIEATGEWTIKIMPHE
jgi:hypothetical protein